MLASSPFLTSIPMSAGFMNPLIFLPMAAAHCYIQLFSTNESETQDLEVFASEDWTKEAESHLMNCIHELFIHIRPHAKRLKLNLQVQVASVREATFMFRKKMGKNCIHSKVSKLTDRELQIIDLIAQGFTNKEIAQQLYISIETVRSHRKHVLLKTGSKNTAMLIKYYDHLLVSN